MESCARKRSHIPLLPEEGIYCNYSFTERDALDASLGKANSCDFQVLRDLMNIPPRVFSKAEIQGVKLSNESSGYSWIGGMDTFGERGRNLQ